MCGLEMLDQQYFFEPGSLGSYPVVPEPRYSRSPHTQLHTETKHYFDALM